MSNSFSAKILLTKSIFCENFKTIYLDCNGVSCNEGLRWCGFNRNVCIIKCNLTSGLSGHLSLSLNSSGSLRSRFNSAATEGFFMNSSAASTPILFSIFHAEQLLIALIFHFFIPVCNSPLHSFFLIR